MAKPILVEVLARTGQFKAELASAVAATEKANSGFHKMGAAAKIAGLALATGLAIGLEKSMKAAVTLEASTARLDQAFKNAGLSVKPYQGAIDAAESSARKLGFTDDDVRTSLGSLVTATHNVNASITDMSTAMDLARFKHISLTDASKTLTMAMAGSQRAAHQLGIIVQPVTTNLDALKASHVNLTTASGYVLEAHAKLLDKMATGQAVIAATSQKVAGQGAAFASTAAGGMAQFHAQTQHLEETLGKTLLPAIVAVLQAMANFADWLSKTGVPAIASAAKSIAGAFRDSYNDVVGFFKSLPGNIAAFFTSLPGKVAAAIASAMGDLESAIKRLFSWHTILGWIKDALSWHSPMPWAVEVGKAIVQNMADGVGGAAGVLKDAVESLAKQFISAPVSAVKNFVDPKTYGQNLGGTPGQNQAIGREMAASHGWGGGTEWNALNALWTRESGWNQFAKNPSSGAYGIPQSLPASKMATFGADYLSNPRTQIAWGLSYIAGRYGDPARAWAHETAYNWYGSGGVFTQPTIIGVGERGPEAVVPLNRMGGGDTLNFYFPNYVGDQQEVIDIVRREFYRVKSRNRTLNLG